MEDPEKSRWKIHSRNPPITPGALPIIVKARRGEVIPLAGCCKEGRGGGGGRGDYRGWRQYKAQLVCWGNKKDE